MTPVRELRRAHEARQVRAKDQSDSGNISRGQQSVQQETERLERASKKLETAGRVVHQVVDLLQDTLIGLRLNRKELRPTSANQRLLQSADETANDIVGFARFDEEALFPPNSSPIKFEEQRAVKAYAQHKKTMDETQNRTDPPEAALALALTNDRLRGDGGVLPTLGRLSKTGHEDPEGTDRSLIGLHRGMYDSRVELDSARKRVQNMASENGPTGANIDVAS
jgi:hypothetical protein